ncbi:MAG: hypothetical protein JOZ25_12885 [Actinobacteria bacterium]|nr:hypothetical protein [Actinomycetota bacterium]
MAAGEPEGAPPQPSEEVHLPEPSYLPVLVALGMTLALVGVILSWIITGIGAVIALYAAIRWVRLTREEMARLPLEH